MLDDVVMWKDLINQRILNKKLRVSNTIKFTNKKTDSDKYYECKIYN